MEAPATIILYALMAIIIALAFWVMRLEKKLRKFLYGKDAKSLEDTIINIREGMERLGASQNETAGSLKNIEERVRKSIRGVETIRFNPFKDSGGNQSFATALLNEEGDGVVISSLYARDRVSIFSKPVKQHASPFELTDEERNALRNAERSITTVT